jgi:hypothetical protein
LKVAGTRLSVVALRNVVRDTVIAVTATAATAAALIALTPLPWPITTLLCILIGLLGAWYILRFDDKPVPHDTLAGRRTLRVLRGLTLLSALALAFAAGWYSQPAPKYYPYVANGKLVADPTYFAPTHHAQSDTFVAPGQEVRVVCSVKNREGLWYRLADDGWGNSDDFLPVPYTGLDAPPKCPGS